MMIETIYVGTGGWYDYKKDLLSPGMRLKVYSKTFRFVEVISTFYKIFDPKTVERWRHQVPHDFEFSVKCYQGLTHKVGIRPIEAAYKTINTMLICCKILNAKILVFETPTSLLLDEKFITDVKQFFGGISLNGVQIAWQFRRRISELSDSLINLMRDLNIIHVVDLSWEDVCYDNDITYTRVFGILSTHDPVLYTIKGKVNIKYCCIVLYIVFAFRSCNTRDSDVDSIHWCNSKAATEGK